MADALDRNRGGAQACRVRRGGADALRDVGAEFVDARHRLRCDAHGGRLAPQARLEARHFRLPVRGELEVARPREALVEQGRVAHPVDAIDADLLTAPCDEVSGARLQHQPQRIDAPDPVCLPTLVVDRQALAGPHRP